MPRRGTTFFQLLTSFRADQRAHSSGIITQESTLLAGKLRNPDQSNRRRRRRLILGRGKS